MNTICLPSKSRFPKSCQALLILTVQFLISKPLPELTPFYGQWKIYQVINTTNVTALSSKEATSFLGKTLTYGRSSAFAGGSKPASVEYRSRLLTENEFVEDYRTPWKQLKFGTGAVTQIDVIDKHSGKLWASPGAVLFFSEKTGLIIRIKGTYFALHKERSN